MTVPEVIINFHCGECGKKVAKLLPFIGDEPLYEVKPGEPIVHTTTFPETPPPLNPGPGDFVLETLERSRGEIPGGRARFANTSWRHVVQDPRQHPTPEWARSIYPNTPTNAALIPKGCHGQFIIPFDVMSDALNRWDRTGRAKAQKVVVHPKAPPSLPGSTTHT